MGYATYTHNYQIPGTTGALNQVTAHVTTTHVTGVLNNHQVCIFTNAFVYSEHRGKGHGSAAHRARLQFARDIGFNYALCTVDDDNVPQCRILRKFYWTPLAPVGRGVTLWGRDLTNLALLPPD